MSDAASTVAHAVECGHGGLWNVGSGLLTPVSELAEICASVTGAELVLADNTPARPARILNWVDDQKARWELGHTNETILERGVSDVGGHIAGLIVSHSSTANVTSCMNS